MAIRHNGTADMNDFIINPDGASSVVLMCEHASHHIPSVFNGMGMSQVDRLSHAAWDPRALKVAQRLSTHRNASLITRQVSRLVCDCNRPPEAEDGMPALSEVIEVPGNRDLSGSERRSSSDRFYRPFNAALKSLIEGKITPIIWTVHSFTPIYNGQKRAVEIGVLHDEDTRLADATLKVADTHISQKVMRNQPYGPEYGVNHTIKEHGINNSLLNVMLEIHSDLIATAQSRRDMAVMIAGWIQKALARTSQTGAWQC